MDRPRAEFCALFATFAPDFSAKSTTLSPTSLSHQLVTHGSARALVKAAVWCHGHAVGRGFGGAIAGFAREVGRLLRKPIAVASSRTAAVGASCVFTNGKGPQGVGRRKTQRDFIA